MVDTRKKNANWIIGDTITKWDQCQLAVLMDIRDELKTLNQLLACRNFTGIPASLSAIQRNTKNDIKT